MIPYPKTFENVFTSERSQKRFNITKVKIKDLDLTSYVNLFKESLNKDMGAIFDIYVRTIWLRRKFRYTPDGGKRGIVSDTAYSIFIRNFIGRDIRLLTRDYAFGKVESYVDEMFPFFDKDNPFTNPDHYKLPFKNFSIDFLTVVYQLDDRMELLSYVDKHVMKYNEFLDFVINHVKSTNETLGWDKYDFMLTTKCPPYVRNNDKKR